LITEPTTLATDYLLAAFTATLAWKLRGSGGAAQRWWAVAFAATAVAGMAGGTVHGFRLVMAPPLTYVLWVMTLEALLVAGLSIIAATYHPAFKWAAVAYAGYAVWVVMHPRFIFAIVGYGAALPFLTTVHLRAWMTSRLPASLWMLQGVAVSVVAAAVQQSGWAPHPHFNHNDLYHLVQAVAVWLLFKGARGSYAQPLARTASATRPTATQ
jgi:hypothetical protein